MGGLHEGLGPRAQPLSPSDMLGLLIFFALAGAGGAIAIDSKSAWVSILIGISGLLVGVVLALTLSDRIVRTTRRKRWLRVSGQIADLVRRHVVRVAVEFERTLEDRQLLVKRGWQPFPALANPASTEFAEMDSALQSLVERIYDSADDLGRGTDGLGRPVDVAISSSARLLQAVDPHMAQLRESITTRVIVVADNPDLVRPLLDLERAHEGWRAFVYDVVRFGTADAQSWQSAAAALAAAAALFAAFQHCADATTAVEPV
jgi:hypothetical protein